MMKISELEGKALDLALYQLLPQSLQPYAQESITEHLYDDPRLWGRIMEENKIDVDWYGVEEVCLLITETS